jgi:hypothetical protein
MAKLALPLVLGLPEMVYVRLPFPLLKLPDAMPAERPVTPVELVVIEL